LTMGEPTHPKATAAGMKHADKAAQHKPANQRRPARRR